MITRRAALAGSIASAGLPGTAANAQKRTWPNREISVILPVSAGGANDLVARAVFAYVSEELKVPIVIKNVPGGSATQGTIQLANAKNDGYTIGNVAYSALLLAPHVMNVPYTLASFALIASAGEPLYGLGVATDSPIKSVDDLVKLAKTRRVTVSSNTIINVTCIFELGTLTGANFQWVPTNSQAEAVTQAAGGHVDCTLQSAPELNAVVDSGRLRLLASANDVRWPGRPDLPTLIELGYNVANKVPLGYGAPAGIDAAIRTELERLILQAAKAPNVVKTLESVGAVSNPLDSAGLSKAFQTAAPLLEKIVKDAGLAKKS